MSHTLTLFIILSITVVASPGPGVLLTVMTTLEEGGRKTPWCSGGLACGTFILAMIAVGGLGAILSARPSLFTFIQALGALYLLWLGVKSFRKPAVDLMSLAEKRDKKETGASPASIFTRGILLQLTNPVLIIFFFSMFPQFIDQDGSFWGQSVAPLRADTRRDPRRVRGRRGVCPPSSHRKARASLGEPDRWILLPRLWPLYAWENHRQNHFRLSQCLRTEFSSQRT